MKQKNRVRPLLEVLEDRMVPALSITFDGSNLTIGDGGLNGGPAAGQLVLNQGAGTVQVRDGAAGVNDLGTYAVSGFVHVNLNNSAASVTVNIGGNSSSG